MVWTDIGACILMLMDVGACNEFGLRLERAVFLESDRILNLVLG